MKIGIDGDIGEIENGAYLDDVSKFQNSETRVTFGTLNLII